MESSVRTRMDDETAERISLLAIKLNCSEAEARRIAIRRGAERLLAEDSGRNTQYADKAENLEKELKALKAQASAAAEASTGALALLSLILPRFCKVEGRSDELLAELGGKGPLDIYHAGCAFGRSIAAAGDTYPAAYSKIPEIVGIDTERVFGLSLTDFKDLLADADRKERGKRGKKRSR